ncbi:hypothetical protein H2204_005455 [Knufia peltigerae]|uniref:VOC domain-containing protein n=2 Tax=Chaetothyriales TaxID=34395 RepID=A0AA38Y5L9_9EURO|nr:hypothetical protein H2204_005455 [Knufia peltigerae]
MTTTKWTPPPNGHPCWINVFATDVQRARTFYHSVFDWKFRDSTTRMDGTEEDPTKIVHFSFGDGCPGGGITKVDQVVKTNGKGGVVLYLMVDDLEGAMKKIVDAGGKKVTEVEPEGKFALTQNFEDTEGNYFGLYQIK